jgi:drug/metabolite transporter (DMT)-like permease
MSRRTAVFGVVLISQLVGMAMAIGCFVLGGEAAPEPVDIAWSVLAGVLGVVGITALYQGLAVGRMGIVAPVTGVLAAVIPAAAGIVLEGMPAPMVLAGIATAIAAVLLVTRVEDEGGGRSGLGLALLSGAAIGGFGIVIAQIGDGHVFGPLTIVRATEAVCIVGGVVVTRTAWRPAASRVPAIIAIGIADMTGNAFYILAVQAGALAVASVVSSLYPVTTVILATVILHERVTRSHAVGIALAALAITLIGLGSA